MKNKLITLLVLAAPLAASAQISLVAGWDFGQFTAEGFATTIPDVSDYSTSIDANFSSTNGSNPVSTHSGVTPVSAGTGSINWSYSDAENGDVFSTAGTRTINTTMAVYPGTLMSNNNSDPYNLALGFTGGFSGNSFTLTADMTGFEDYNPTDFGNFSNFSFAATSRSAVSIEWFLGGSSIGTSSFNTGSLTTYTDQYLDLPTSFYGSASTLTGVVTGTEAFGIDNVQVYGQAVPEPSTYAAIAGFLALGVAAYRRRRRS
jgi:hypothetical protein